MCIFHIFSWEGEAYLRSDGRCCWDISIFQLCNLRNLFNPNHPPSSIHWPWRSASGFGFILKAVFNFFEVSCWRIFGLTCDSRRDLQISFSRLQSFKEAYHTKNLGSAFNRGNGSKGTWKENQEVQKWFDRFVRDENILYLISAFPGAVREPICNCTELKYKKIRERIWQEAPPNPPRSSVKCKM